MRAFALAMMGLWIAGCGTRECKDGTVRLTLTFEGAPATRRWKRRTR